MKAIIVIIIWVSYNLDLLLGGKYITISEKLYSSFSMVDTKSDSYKIRLLFQRTLTYTIYKILGWLSHYYIKAKNES